MDKREYVAAVRIQTRRLERLLRAFPLGAVLFMLFAYMEVRTGFLIDLPPLASRYLLDTIFTRFSLSEFRILLEGAGATSTLPLLLFLYWGYHIVGFLLFALPPLLIFVRKRLLPPHRRGVYRAGILKEAILKYPQNPSLLRRFSLGIKISGSDFYRLIVPISRRWYKDAQYQWLSLTAISKPERRIVSTLARVRESMIIFVRKRRPMDGFVRPLTLLEDFFFQVAQRVEHGGAPGRSRDQNLSEVAILAAFASAVSPAILEAKRIGKAEKAPTQRLRWLAEVLTSPFVRNALMLSAAAGFVMALGTVLFKISTSQAFLTWFTVAFGSLTISVGVTAFSIHEARHRRSSGPRAGPGPAA